jgi:hypothetical protein
VLFFGDLVQLREGISLFDEYKVDCKYTAEHHSPDEKLHKEQLMAIQMSQ